MRILLATGLLLERHHCRVWSTLELQSKEVLSVLGQLVTALAAKVCSLPLSCSIGPLPSSEIPQICKTRFLRIPDLASCAALVFWPIEFPMATSTEAPETFATAENGSFPPISPCATRVSITLGSCAIASASAGTGAGLRHLPHVLDR